MPVYTAGEWNDALQTVLRKHLTKAATLGAELELASGTVKSYKGLGQRLKSIIKASVDKVLSKGAAIYHKVNETTGTIIDAAVTAARQAGDTAKEVAAKVKDVLTGEAGKERAADIARTETTLGLTTGQEAQRQEWTEDGHDLNKTWNTMGDDAVREMHADAEGQTVGLTEHFTVGGEQAYGPGDVGLSAANRCGCRCWTTTSVA